MRQFRLSLPEFSPDKSLTARATYGLPGSHPPPAPALLDDAPVRPYVTASLFSRLPYTWITPMMMLGFQRTVQVSDLWRMRPEQEAGYLTDRLEAAWARRVEAAESLESALGERGGDAGAGEAREVGLPWETRRDGADVARRGREEGGEFGVGIE